MEPGPVRRANMPCKEGGFNLTKFIRQQLSAYYLVRAAACTTLFLNATAIQGLPLLDWVGNWTFALSFRARTLGLSPHFEL